MPGGAPSKRTRLACLGHGCEVPPDRLQAEIGAELSAGRSKVLVVEDEGIVALDIESQVASLGYDVVGTAISGEEAIAKTDQLEPDVILMDIRLQGDLDGIAAAEQIHDSRDTPIIYLTAFADDATVRRVQADDPAAYLLKPFDERELGVAIHTALRQSRIHRMIRVRENWLCAVLHGLPAAVVATDTEGRITCMSQEAERLSGWREAEALGLDAEQVIGPAIPEPGPLRRWTLVARDGAQHPVEAATAPLCPGPRQAGTVWVLHDAAAEHRAVAERDDLLAIVSHDLRTPLTSITAAAELLQRSPEIAGKGPDVQARTKAILGGVARMAQLLDDLREITSIDAGRLRLGPLGACPAAEVLREAHQIFESLAAESGRRLLLELPPPDVATPCDRQRIFQVLSNLIGNALKFTPKGGDITLRAEVVGDEVVYSVRDTGPGIPPDQLPHVFERHWQAPATARRGSGLGLYIAKGVVEAHRGRISVVSEPGKGSCFQFTLPCH